MPWKCMAQVCGTLAATHANAAFAAPAHTHLFSVTTAAGTALGDPIEVGALAAVINAPSTAAVELSAAKSLVGHSEPAAGALGLMRVVSRLEKQQRAAIMHLRTLNPYVGTALEDSSTTFAAGRQQGPGITASRGAWHSGASAFAFQGTNAHAIVGSRSVALLHDDSTAGSIWRRRRFWFGPPPHQLLLRAGSTHGRVTYELAFGRAGLAYVWEHQVWQKEILGPGTGPTDLRPPRDAVGCSPKCPCPYTTPCPGSWEGAGARCCDAGGW